MRIRESNKLSSRRVLLVSAEQALDPLLAKHLLAQGAEIRTAGPYADIRELVERHRPDLMVFDGLPQGLSRREPEQMDSLPPMFVIGQVGGVDEELVALKMGVADYVDRHTRHEIVAERVARCLTRRKRLGQALKKVSELSELSLTDEATGLYNQRYLFRRLQQEFERCKRYGQSLAVLMVDVDSFRTVNDRTEYAFGTEVLKVLARLLTKTHRGSDTVCRYAGDAFAVLLPELELAQGQTAAERLRLLVENHLFLSRRWRSRITVSIGVAAYPDCAITSADELLRLADRAMHEAKAEGRNRSQCASVVAVL